MSYEISLYLKSFLDRAIESSLGDWSDADPIPEAAIRSILDQARSEGFVGDEDSGFLLDSDAVLAEMHVYPGQIAFSIPYGSRADASIELCTRLAKRAEEEHALGLWDPQEGNMDTRAWLDSLRTGDDDLRAEAAQELGNHDPELVLEALVLAARSDPLEEVRRIAIESIGEFGEEAAEAIDDVLALLSDPNPIIVYWATYVLGRLGPSATKALPALEALTKSHEEGPRYGAIDAIRRIRDAARR